MFDVLGKRLCQADEGEASAKRCRSEVKWLGGLVEAVVRRRRGPRRSSGRSASPRAGRRGRSAGTVVADGPRPDIGVEEAGASRRTSAGRPPSGGTSPGNAQVLPSSGCEGVVQHSGDQVGVVDFGIRRLCWMLAAVEAVRSRSASNVVISASGLRRQAPLVVGDPGEHVQRLVRERTQGEQVEVLGRVHAASRRPTTNGTGPARAGTCDDEDRDPATCGPRRSASLPNCGDLGANRRR